MVSFKIILFLLTLLRLSCFCIAQQINLLKPGNKYRIVHRGVDEGLGKERWHNAIIKDANGFLWFGSSHGALSRFDGSSFKRYYSGKHKAGNIRNEHCTAIVEDSMHNLWIGTFKGLSRYNIQADTFTNFPIYVNPTTSEELVVPFWTTRNEVFCIEAGNQITSYNIHSSKRKKILDIHAADKAGTGFLRESYAIFDAPSNSIWMLPEGEEGLVQFSLSTGMCTFHNRTEYATKRDSWGRTDSEAMCFDKKRNCIWINSHDGLIQFTLKDQQFHHIDALNQFLGLQDYHRMVGIAIDLKGRVWLATMPKGLLIYDPESHIVRDDIPDTTSQQEVADGNLKIYCDRDGIVWLSYWMLKEIYELIPFSPIVHSYKANPNKPDSLSSLAIGNMVAGEHGELWIGTAHGLNIFNPNTEAFKVLLAKDLPGIQGQSIIPIVIDTVRKRAWITATPPSRIYSMDLLTKKSIPVVLRDTAGKIIPIVGVVGSNQYKNGCLIIDRGYGIFEINEDSSRARLVIPFHKEIFKSILVEDNVLLLKSFPDYFAYQNTGGKWIKVQHPLNGIGWDDIAYVSRNQTYWVAASGQLFHLDKDFRTIRRYDDMDELLKGILTLLPDHNGNIWFINDRKAVGKLNEKTGTVNTLSEQDGYQKQWYDSYTTPAKEAGGNIYVVGNSLAPETSLEKIDLDKSNSYPAVTVYFRSLEIKDYTSTLSAGINNVETLLLNYFQNRINIETGVIDYYSNGKNHIRYKLESNQKNVDWQYALAKSVIHYEELPPGKYRLVIQASNAGNEFNGPYKILLITIRPAFWNTWWFSILIAMVLTTGIYTLFRYRLRQKTNVFEMRNRISQDLHDEIGGSISGINLLSQMASEKLLANELQEASAYLVKVKNYTQDVIEKLSDMVWIFNPQNDSTEKLLQRLKSFAFSVALAKKIKVSFETDKDGDTINFSIRERKAIYLISKEALNNIFKYAACNNIYYNLHGKASKWQLTIKDDGRGFIPAESKGGNGLKNMKARAEEIGANLTIQSEIAVGTTITVHS